eukprot:TRINITY_DN747_c0_g1_i1.p1 TRINITY_DN747_c0_g1~~TRINITY_DN747_c0_g1_i1.p1  ORF type:complete len:1284 (+),score=325.47 TRINITY_DN747_c0_g1_i1:126-3977(+)
MKSGSILFTVLVQIFSVSSQIRSSCHEAPSTGVFYIDGEPSYCLSENSVGYQLITHLSSFQQPNAKIFSMSPIDPHSSTSNHNQDWLATLTPGASYQLRQQFFNLEESERNPIFDATWEFDHISGSQLAHVPLRNKKVMVTSLVDPYDDQQQHFWTPGFGLPSGEVCPSVFDRLWPGWNGIVTIGSSCDRESFLQETKSFILNYYISEVQSPEVPHLNKRWASNATIYYVSPNGVGSGTRSSPFKLSNVPWSGPPGIVFLQKGSHNLTGPFFINSGWTIEGNFDATWNKLITASATFISITSSMRGVFHPVTAVMTNHLIGFDMAMESDITFRDLVVQVLPPPFTGSFTVYAFRIANCTNIQIERVQVMTPAAGNGTLVSGVPPSPPDAGMGCQNTSICFGRGGSGPSLGGQGGFGNGTNNGFGYPGANASTGAIGGPGGSLNTAGGAGASGPANPFNFNVPSVPLYLQYFYPMPGSVGFPGDDGAGGGGGGTSNSTQCSITVIGGGGGGGGQGGQGGYGGDGGGGNFGVYVYGCINCTFPDLYGYLWGNGSSTLGAAGMGSAGSMGASGGRGGEGGTGQQGSNGASMLYYPLTTPYLPTGYLTGFQSMFITSTFCTNSEVMVVGAGIFTWSSPHITNRDSPATIDSSISSTIYLSFSNVGNYGITVESLPYRNLFTMVTPRVLPSLHNVTLNDTSAVYLFYNPSGDDLTLYETWTFTGNVSQVISTRSWAKPTPYLRIRIFFNTSIATTNPYLKVKFSSATCGSSPVLWFPILNVSSSSSTFSTSQPTSSSSSIQSTWTSSSTSSSTSGNGVNTLCEDIYNSADNCTIEDNNVQVPTLTYVKPYLTIPSNAGLVVQGNLTLTRNVTVQFEVSEVSTGVNLTRSVIQVEGTLYASGNLTLTVTSILDMDTDYTIIFCLFDNMEGDFNLNVQLENSRTRQTLCAHGTPDKKSKSYGATVRVTNCVQGLETSSGKNETKIIIIVCVIGGLLILGIILVVAILIMRRPHRDLEEVGQVDMTPAFLKGNVIIDKKIGEGQFGEVFLGTWDGNTVAMKKMKEDDAQDFASEMATLSKVIHPHVVQYFGMAKVDQHVYLMMEYMSLGSVKNQTKSLNSLVNVLDVAAQCAAGMIHLHDKGIVHRDLALRNILFARTDDGFVAKVADFGMSRTTEQGHYTSAGGKIAIKWAAPEILQYQQFSNASDVWAFGVTLWELFSDGANPYPGMTMTEANQKIVDGYRMEPPKSCPDDIQRLMQQIWQTDPSCRPSFREISDRLIKARDECQRDSQ